MRMMGSVLGRSHLVLALAIVATLANGLSLRAQTARLFAAQAEPIGTGETSVRRGSSEASVSLEGEVPGVPSTLRVTRAGRLFERSIALGLHADVLWSPDASRFAITGSDGGANGQYR